MINVEITVTVKIGKILKVLPAKKMILVNRFVEAWLFIYLKKPTFV